MSFNSLALSLPEQALRYYDPATDSRQSAAWLRWPNMDFRCGNGR